MLSPLTISVVDGTRLSVTRKLVLLVMFCLAQFLDAFNITALFTAIPALEVSMNMTASQSTWMFSASQLTFSSFLLIVRTNLVDRDLHFTHYFRVAVSATYITPVSAVLPTLACDADSSTETAFIGGVFGLGITSLCAGFVDDKIPIIILRALSGIGECSRLYAGSG
jgi:MFS family permease